jgi:hypothetical protein
MIRSLGNRVIRRLGTNVSSDLHRYQWKVRPRLNALGGGAEQITTPTMAAMAPRPQKERVGESTVVTARLITRPFATRGVSQSAILPSRRENMTGTGYGSDRRQSPSHVQNSTATVSSDELGSDRPRLTTTTVMSRFRATKRPPRLAANVSHV